MNAAQRYENESRDIVRRGGKKKKKKRSICFLEKKNSSSERKFMFSYEKYNLKFQIETKSKLQRKPNYILNYRY